MPATKDGKTWRSQFYYEDWQGVRHKKNKRGFKTKAEAEEWERNFRQQQRKDLDINFENFVEIYFADVENRLRESTIKNKRYVFDLKVIPYFKKKKMCEIVSESGADFIKTSTGFSTAGATREDVALFAKYVTGDIKIKAAGGIASLADAEDFIKLGADRLGTSRIVKLVKNEKASGY